MRSIIIILLILLSVPAYAADLYVTPAGAGSANGSDWSNALAWTFNPVRGNIYYIAGGAYGSKSLSVAASGTDTITLRKATAANSGSVDGWQISYANQAVITAAAEDAAGITLSTPYWIIDGVSRTGARTGYGFKIIGPAGANKMGVLTTNNGTATNLTFSYIEITSPNTPIAQDCINGGTCTDKGIYLNHDTSTSDMSVTNCWIHDVALPIYLGNVNTVTIDNCLSERNDSESDHHSEGISAKGGGAHTITNNIWVDIEGTAIWAYMNGGSTTGINIWNNIVYQTSTTPTLGNGVFTCTNNNTTCNNLNFFNNTFSNIAGAAHVDLGTGEGLTISNFLVKNNLWFCNSASCAASTSETDADFTYATNWYGGVTYRAEETTARNGGSENPFNSSATYDFSPKVGASVRGVGTNLSATFTTDILGTTRSNWDIGAYAITGGLATPISGMTVGSGATITGVGVSGGGVITGVQ